MCTKRQILSPSGSLFNKNSKYVDPLGITKTAVGDPTGGIRKERAAIAAEEADERRRTADAKNVLPYALEDAAKAARSATSNSINQRTKGKRSAFAVSLLGSAGG